MTDTRPVQDDRLSARYFVISHRKTKFEDDSENLAVFATRALAQRRVARLQKDKDTLGIEVEEHLYRRLTLGLCSIRTVYEYTKPETETKTKTQPKQ